MWLEMALCSKIYIASVIVYYGGVQVAEVLVREIKKWKALKKLLEYTAKEPNVELRWSELRNILASAGLSLVYAEKLIIELDMRGIVSKTLKAGKIYYRINVEKLREVVEAIESQ
jgi:acetylglutamate kinase